MGSSLRLIGDIQWLWSDVVVDSSRLRIHMWVQDASLTRTLLTMTSAERARLCSNISFADPSEQRLQSRYGREKEITLLPVDSRLPPGLPRAVTANSASQVDSRERSRFDSRTQAENPPYCDWGSKKGENCLLRKSSEPRLTVRSLIHSESEFAENPPIRLSRGQRRSRVCSTTPS